MSFTSERPFFLNPAEATRAAAMVIVLALLPRFLMAGKPAPPPSFTPAAVYVQEKSGGARDLMLLDDTFTQTKLLLSATSSMRIRAPRFSPDGSMVVFGSGAALNVLRLQDGAQWNIVTLADDNSWNTAAWFGRLILYADVSTTPCSSSGGFGRDLFLIEVDEGGRAVPGSKKQLTATPCLDEFFPSWSRDGRRVVANVWVGNDQELFVLDFDSSTREITASRSLVGLLGPMFLSGPAQWNKSWSSSGDVIAFSGCPKPSAIITKDLWFIDVDRQVTRRFPAEFVKSFPSFAPDDQRLVIVNYGTSTYDIRVITNAAALLDGTAQIPDETVTAARAGRKIQELFDCDWKPVP